MFNFKKKEKVEEDLKTNSGELDLKDLEQEIVELVDIVEESEKDAGISSELKLTEEVPEEKEAEDSILEDIDFPTEVRQIAEEFEESLPHLDEEPTSLDLDKELEENTTKRPYGDKVIAETLGLGEDDSLVTALRSEKLMGPAPSEKKSDPVAEFSEDSFGDDKTLLVDVTNGIADLKSDLDNEDEQGILTLAEELNDEKNTTVDTMALKNCPLIENSAELRLKDDLSKETDEPDINSIQETKVDLSLSQILSTDSLETDLKEELKEDFMMDSSEIAYQETQLEIPTEDVFNLADKPDDQTAMEQSVEEEANEEAEEEPLVFSGGAVDEALKVEKPEEPTFEQVAESIDRDEIAEKILESIRPEIVEMVKESLKKELPGIIERVIREEVERIKKVLAKS